MSLEGGITGASGGLLEGAGNRFHFLLAGLRNGTAVSMGTAAGEKQAWQQRNEPYSPDIWPAILERVAVPAPCSNGTIGYSVPLDSAAVVIGSTNLANFMVRRRRCGQA